MFTILSMAASSPFSSETGGWGVRTSSCSSTTSSFETVAALFLPLRLFSARSCLADLDLICVGEGDGIDADAFSGAGAVTRGGVGGFSVTRGSGGET